MYEDLIKALRLAADKQRFGNYPTITVNVGTAYELATALESLTAQLAALQAENGEKDEEIEKLRMQVRVKDACISGKSSIITHMETERDAARPSAEVLEAIDELVEFARDRMSIGVWLGYVNVLNDWRGAQGEGVSVERLSKEQIEAVIQEAKERCPYYGEPDGCNAHGGPLMCCDELDEVGELAKTACSLGPRRGVGRAGQGP